MEITANNFDEWELNRVCEFVAKHNKKVFSSPNKVKAAIFSRAQEIKMGEYVDTCGFVIMHLNKKKYNLEGWGEPTGESFFKVCVGSCILTN